MEDSICTCKPSLLFMAFVCAIAFVAMPARSASAYEGTEQIFENDEMLEIPYRLMKKWTDFKKRSIPRRALIPHFE
ncbi:conserved hypothetical protein [Echinococcus multilocularis]|uniref:Neuropeptide n=1 Tax=Echinococcus multilocularis TaxID=6211 RepID=A0A068Y349_ECHMU|nr:conserved hypothetical protein [Echinococcus multilocularis]